MNQPRNLAASVRQRLLNIAKRDGEAFDLVLTRYALERLLYRLGKSPYSHKFLLKGAMLFAALADAHVSNFKATWPAGGPWQIRTQQ
ncbi:MAG: hypothetical protein ACYCZJ_06880 [Sulfuriferula sp.]